MTTTVVRYQVKPERADENQRLVEDVFAELAERQPAGLRYATFRLHDGVTFVHVATVEAGTTSNPLFSVPAFSVFQAEIADRCDVQPLALGADVVGSYRLLSD
jgi:hypothetical protein